MIVMKIIELQGKLPEEVIESFKKRGIAELTPPQALAVEYGLLEGRDFVVAAPTASGKTLIAEMAMLRSVMRGRKKAIYVAPMRALVSEKYHEFKEAYPEIKVAMSIGDLDSLDSWLHEYQIVLASTEKLDSLIRHGAEWLDSVGCIVFDEVHMLDDSTRGPTLEILMTRLKRIAKDSQIIALSATVGNAKELAEWLGSELIESDYRPVELRKGIEQNSTIYYADGEEALDNGSKLAEIRIAANTFDIHKQILFFYSTKRNTEAGAERLSPLTSSVLSQEEKLKLSEVSARILGALGRPTTQCEKLAKLVEKGVAFHHSGLVNEQRHAVEEAFKEGLIKAICSTTTLGMGVNLPAHTVVVRDTVRYDAEYGSVRMGVNVVTQLFGRAGRPKYDKMGRALLIAKSKEDMRSLYERYVDGELEPVESKLGMESVLRTHLLSFIATKFLTSKESISDFMAGTFYGYQYADMNDLNRIISRVLKELQEWNFIESYGSMYRATKVGERVSELYIDPMSAKWMIDSLPKATDSISMLFMISNTIEMRPYVKIVEEAEERFFSYQQMIESEGGYILSEEVGYYDPLKPFSTSIMLNDWISEKHEQEITQKYGTTPGALYTKINNADWLLYSAAELGKLLKVSSRKLTEVRVRMRYGIKEELMDLVRLEGIGRVRARLLFMNGIPDVKSLRKAGAREKVERLLGKEIAKRVYEQLSE